MDGNELMERLLEGPCIVVDFLPERVPAGSPGCFFDVEECFLSDVEEVGRFAKCARRIVLKLACYFAIEVFDSSCDKWMDRIAIADLAKLVESVVESKRGGVNVLVPNEECMLAIEGGSFSMTAYGLDERFLALLRNLAKSEGLFCWESLG